MLLSILELQYKELVVIQKAFYNKFKQDLGSSDAINEYIEVLLRQFESYTSDESSFQSIASRYGLRVNDVSPQVAICKIREYYIVSVYQVFEEFLNQMHAFLKEYGVYKENKDSSTSMLKHIHVNLVGMKKTSENAYLYYLICDYYRLIRNLCAHTDNINKAQNVYQKLFERKDEINVLFQKLQAPNRYDNINFDDFILYSRASKKLAEIYISNIEYDIDKIITNFDIGHLRVYRNNPKRLSKALETEIKFSFCMKPETVKMVVDMIVKMI